MHDYKGMNKRKTEQYRDEKLPYDHCHHACRRLPKRRKLLFVKGRMRLSIAWAVGGRMDEVNETVSQ
jgi:hypothetical protein